MITSMTAEEAESSDGEVSDPILVDDEQDKDLAAPAWHPPIAKGMGSLVGVYEIDPLTDRRWTGLIDRHPDSSVFHTGAWLRCLKDTYGYKPMARTTNSPEEELDNAVVFCEVKSWLTGRRLVSLPFSDHCQPLANPAQLKVIAEQLTVGVAHREWKYVELRPKAASVLTRIASVGASERFSYQCIDLRPEITTIYRAFHESCIRRKIKKAEKEDLVYESGRSEKLLEKFRYLLLLTRRRHKLPPQPQLWFHNIASSLAGQMSIHCVSKEGMPIACILTLAHKKSVIYKYGCSDSRFNNLGGTPFLFWKVIQEAKAVGAEELDLGRSGYDDPGLIAFKGHLGAESSVLTYYRSPAPLTRADRPASTLSSWARAALVRLPDPLFSAAGERLYRHMG